PGLTEVGTIMPIGPRLVEFGELVGIAEIQEPFTVAATSEAVHESDGIRPIPNKRRLNRDYRHALALDHSYSANKMIKHLVIDDLLGNKWLGKMTSEEFWSIYSNIGKVCQVVRDLLCSHLRMHVTTTEGHFAVIIHRL